MNTKKCCKCKEIKDVSEFYKDRSRGNGLFARCKNCERLAYRNNRERNPLTHSNKDRKYYVSNKEKIKKWRLAYYIKNRHKYKAWKQVHRALALGIIKKNNECDSCKLKIKTHAHHEDYSKPLDVIWLCSRCHQRRHSEQVKILPHQSFF